MQAITLEMHICDQRRSYNVTFEGDAAEQMAISYVKARWSTHAIYEIESNPIDQQYTQLLDLLYPTCEHGLSQSNCYGSQHYYFDEEEQARGFRNGY
jgi:hypothetical protein